MGQTERQIDRHNSQAGKQTIFIVVSYHVFVFRCRSVTISNWSDVIVHYQWKPLASALDDEHQREEFVHSLDRVEEVERDEFLDECQADPTMRDQMSLLTRTFENRRKAS